MIDGQGWKWPLNWLTKYPWLNKIVVPILSNTPDKPVWINSNGEEKRFSTSNVWKDVRGNGNRVCWKDLVWHSNCIPKHTFILWLAIKTRLCTQDRLAKRYPNNCFTCSLCGNGIDLHDHLFFNCEFAGDVRKRVCDMAKIEFKKSTWKDTVETLSNENH